MHLKICRGSPVLTPETNPPATNNTEATTDTTLAQVTKPNDDENVADNEPTYASIVGTYQGAEVNVGSVTATFYSDGTLSVDTATVFFSGTWTQSYGQAHNQSKRFEFRSCAGMKSKKPLPKFLAFLSRRSIQI